MKELIPEVSQTASIWPLLPLGQVLEKVSTGFATGKRDAAGIIQLRMNNVSPLGQFDWSILTRVPKEEINEGQLLQAGDVLFNNTNSTELVGKSALFLGHDEPVVYSNHFTRLRVNKSKLLPAYLAFWLQLQWQNRVFADICNQWVGQSAVQPNKLTALQIPVPSLEEQHYIADKLSKRLQALEESRAAAEAQLKTLRLLPAALLRAAFVLDLEKASNVTPPPPPARNNTIFAQRRMAFCVFRGHMRDKSQKEFNFRASSKRPNYFHSDASRG